MVRPEFMDLQGWAAQLLIDFPNDVLPQPPAEEEWEPWATIVAACPSFTKVNCPPGRGFPDWRSWAYAVLLTNPVAT